ncbi:GNAT family N-acetyltransferase [Psychrobacillus psychrotolerans]|uniref:GNAT family N-acetyltransferase n=1 Tax=Psychrobacillus psychrotolerans TaxID=126156 RepID=UPI003314A5A9
MINLTMYNNSYRKPLENYPLSVEQLSFTGHPLELLERANINASYTPIIITEDDQVAGFFVLDTGEDKFHYTDIEESILLRGYSIHPDYQGKGIAQASMILLQSFVAKHFPHVNRIVLGVNEANIAAQAVYIKSGFIDEGRRFNGRSGIQIAMSKRICLESINDV